jgi:hypothetical protein
MEAKPLPRIVMRPDNLNERNTEFEQAPLRQPVFLNSVPKCGTHLIRNMMRMFVPVAQQYHATFVQVPLLRQHGPAAFDPKQPKLSWGHLLFDDMGAILLKPARHILLVRDPYDWVLARARFFLSENFEGNLNHLRTGNVDVNDLLNMMIFGIHGRAPNMEEIFRFNAVAWLGTTTYLVRYEELVANLKRIDTREAELYFMALFNACGIDMPEDWRKRIVVGSDRKQSSTARENLEGGIDLPDELPDIQKRMVNYAAPGLRQILGYT